MVGFDVNGEHVAHYLVDTVLEDTPRCKQVVEVIGVPCRRHGDPLLVTALEQDAVVKRDSYVFLKLFISGF